MSTIRQLEKGEALSSDGSMIEAYGYTIDDMFIVKPKQSECGRFDVDPMEAYGLSPEEVEAVEKANAGLDLL